MPVFDIHPIGDHNPDIAGTPVGGYFDGGTRYVVCERDGSRWVLNSQPLGEGDNSPIEHLPLFGFFGGGASWGVSGAKRGTPTTSWIIARTAHIASTPLEGEGFDVHYGDGKAFLLTRRRA